MMSEDEIKKRLKVLRIKEEFTDVTLNHVNSAFRKLATVMHPVKAGDSSTAAFQELLNSCLILR